jgi:integrase
VTGYFVMDLSVEEYTSFDSTTKADITEVATGLPFSLWATSYLRDFEAAGSTVLTEAYQLKFVLEYFESKLIDYIDRVESGSFLTEDELAEFFYSCRHTKNSIINTDPKIASIHHFTRKSLDRLIHATTHSNSNVAAHTTRVRLTTFMRFTKHLFRYMHARPGNRVPDDLKYNYDCLLSDVKDEKKKVKNDDDVVKDVFEQAITTDNYFKLLRVIKPSDAENPWTELTRSRNHIILQLFIETGNRLGAICKLKISDLRDDANPRFLVTRTPNDPTDDRKRAPAAKTRANSSAISRELMQEIKLYIDTDRAQYPASEQHDFLFVSHKGDTSGGPIGTRSVSTIVSNLSEVINEHIHPHLLRHKWNEIFSENTEKLGYTPEQIEDIRKYACGWTENSSMSVIYNEFRHAVTVQKISAQEQSKFIPNKSEAKDE